MVLEIPDDADNPYEIKVEMERYRRKSLDEVTVSASKVMFYYKGDTLVYDAGAFVLAEGSMLDALLAQMPGLELKSNGEILCNGKRVQNLLVNGRDIFNGNRELMLDNLAAYAIKDIAFYDKMGRIGELMGFKTGDEVYVMDVRLKRNYSHGWIVNAEAGCGSARRYLGKLFGMWFSDNVSMTAYSGANNLSDSKTPGRSDDAWSQSDMGAGVNSNLKGGITYNAKGYDDRWELKGSVGTERHTSDSRRSSSVENYLGTSNLYSYFWNTTKRRNFNVNTGHQFFARLGERANLDVKPAFSYSSMRSSADNTSAVFREKVTGLSKARLLAIYSDGSSLADSMLNRYVSENISRGHGINASADISSPIKLKSGFWGNMLELSASGTYSNDFTRDFARFAINYGAESRPADFDHRYTRRYPHHDIRLSAGATFTQYFKRPFGRMSFKYDFRYAEQARTADVFSLSSMSGYDPEQWPTDFLPSGGEHKDHFIPSLSDRSTLTEWTHHLCLVPWFEQIRLKQNWALFMWGNVNLDISRRRLDYVSNNIPLSMTRDDLLPEVSVGMSLNPLISSAAWRYNLTYRFKRDRIHDMMYLVDRPVTNPLVIYRGNPDVRNTSENFLTFVATRRGQTMLRHEFKLSARYYNSAIDYYYTVDPQTGACVYQVENVNGNCQADIGYELFTPFGRNSKFNLSSRTDMSYRRDVSDMRDNVMNNFSAGENLKISWQTGRHRVSLLGDVSMNRYVHSNSLYDDFTSFTCRYGAESVLNFPKGWGVSTDLTLYTRRGYGDSRLNTTDLVWNARVSKSLFKGALVLVADGYDLLRQLSNVSYTVNAQARTEVVTNVIPSYVLFHAQWRFNRQPRR